MYRCIALQHLSKKRPQKVRLKLMDDSSNIAAFLHTNFDAHQRSSIETNKRLSAARTGVRRNENFDKLQAGYLFPEV